MVLLFIGGNEWIIILVVVVFLIMFGPKKIPEISRSIGKAMAEFERGKRQLQLAIKEETDPIIEDAKKDLDPERDASEELSAETDSDADTDTEAKDDGEEREPKNELLKLEREYVIKTAQSLGIGVEGKSMNQLKRTIELISGKPFRF